MDVTLGDSGVVDAVEESELYRAHPPYVVEVKAPVAGAVVVLRIRVGVAEPCLVQFFLGVGLRGFEAGDELAVGRLGVAPEAAVVRSGGLEEEGFLLVVDSREVGDLPRRKAFHADVDVLAGDFAVGLGSGFAEDSDDLLQRFDVVVAENGRDHERAGRQGRRRRTVDFDRRENSGAEPLLRHLPRNRQQGGSAHRQSRSTRQIQTQSRGICRRAGGISIFTCIFRQSTLYYITTQWRTYQCATNNTTMDRRFSSVFLILSGIHFIRWRCCFLSRRPYVFSSFYFPNFL